MSARSAWARPQTPPRTSTTGLEKKERKPSKKKREKLEAEKDKEVRGVLKRRKKNHGLKKDLDQGSGGEYRQVHMESLERDKKYCKEHEGIMVGLEKAIAIVAIEEEK